MFFFFQCSVLFCMEMMHLGNSSVCRPYICGLVVSKGSPLAYMVKFIVLVFSCRTNGRCLPSSLEGCEENMSNSGEGKRASPGPPLQPQTCYWLNLQPQALLQSHAIHIGEGGHGLVRKRGVSFCVMPCFICPEVPSFLILAFIQPIYNIFITGNG